MKTSILSCKTRHFPASLVDDRHMTMAQRSGVGEECISEITRGGATRVLHLVPNLDLGGAPRGVTELVTRLSQTAGLAVRLCVLGSQDKTFAEYALPQRPIYLDRPYRIGNPWAMWKCVQAVRAEVRRFQPHLIHSHLLPADLIAALSVRGGGVLHVSHIRGTPPTLAARGWRNTVKRQVYRFSLRRRTSFVAVSQGAKDFTCRTLGIRPDRVRVVLNGIDLTVFDGGPTRTRAANGDAPLVIGSAGRLTPEKGHGILLEAARILAEEGLEFRIRIAGEGSLRERLWQMAGDAHLAERLELSGAVNDMAAFYRDLDIFVLPSLAEGLPRALLEAMAMGVPVVSSDVTGAGEVVEHELHGLLVPTNDSPSLASAIRRLMTQPVLRRRLAAAGQERIRATFSSERVAAEVAELYNRLLRFAPGFSNGG